MVKISDIAEKANVSITAVSLALNNKPGVGEETKKRILKIAEEYNYIKTTKTSKNSSIRLMRIVKHGHTINRDHDIFLSHYIDNISDAGKSYNCDVQVVSCLMNEADTKIQSFYSENVSGVIIIGTELITDDIKKLQDNPIPVVFIDTHFSEINSDFITMDNYSAVNSILCHLLENNHKQISMVSSHFNVENFRHRERAFYFFADQHSSIKTGSFKVDSTFDGAYLDFKQIIERQGTLPTALFCVNDIIALGCIKALTEKGFKIPEDISIVGFDNIPQSRMAVPALTTIQVDHETISHYAMRVLFDRIEKVSPTPVKIAVGTTLITRDSVKNI